MLSPRHILITGASSGIGSAIALEYAASDTRLTLLGRNVERLQKIAADCEAKGSKVVTMQVEVTEPEAMVAAINEADAEQPLDLVFANAGVSAGTDSGNESLDQVRRVFDVNIMGVMNTAMPAVDLMVKRGQGQVGLISSLAGFRGIPGSPAYSGSKAGVMVFGEALRGQVAGAGVEINVINPGYVRSAMTARNEYKMPFLMDADRAARIIRNGMMKNKARIAFPLPMLIAVRLLQVLPPAWTDPLMRLLPKKASGGVD